MGATPPSRSGNAPPRCPIGRGPQSTGVARVRRLRTGGSTLSSDRFNGRGRNRTEAADRTWPVGRRLNHSVKPSMQYLFGKVGLSSETLRVQPPGSMRRRPQSCAAGAGCGILGCPFYLKARVASGCYKQHAIHNTQHTTRNTQHITHNTQQTTHNTQHATNNIKGDGGGGRCMC